MLNTASVPHHQRQAPHHVVQHHRPSQQSALSSLADPAARAAAFAKLQLLQLQQAQQHDQLLLVPSEGGSPPGLLLQEPLYATASLVVGEAPPTPPGSSMPSTSTTSTSPSTSSTAGDVDVLKDSIRNVEELMKAPQQAHSAIAQIHKGQRISGVGQEDFVRARKIKSPCSAFAEVAEIKMIVYQLLLAPSNAQHITNLTGLQGMAGIQALLHQASVSANSGDSLSTSPLHNNNNGLNGTNSRKRSAHFGGGPSQPEQPVALRPALGNCGGINGGAGGSFMPTWTSASPWNLISGLRTSPTLPGAAPTTETASAGDNKLWSSPSSVESGHKPESNAGDSNIDPVGMESDGSPTSSTCTQSPADVLAFAAAAVHNSQMNGINLNGGHERKPRKQISDDYVKLIRQQHELSGKEITDIQIPVPEALECDPTFVAISEKQIVDQVVQTKKFDEMSAKDIQETTTQLCKKLAEKRVFGPRLMAQTTVAGPNHSTYNNLPDEGIIYIQYVCRNVLKDKLKTEEEFWDVFREAMRKLAARCRRVRHAKKTKSMKENGVTPLLQTENPLMFMSQPTDNWMEIVKNNVQAANAIKQETPTESLAMQLLNFANQNGMKSESPEEAQPTLSFKPAVISEWVEGLQRLSQQQQQQQQQQPSSSSAAQSPVISPSLQHVLHQDA